MGSKKRKMAKSSKEESESASSLKRIKKESEPPEKKDEIPVSDSNSETASGSRLDFSCFKEVEKHFKEVSRAAKNPEEQEMPDVINIINFAECRASELAMVTKIIQNKKQPKQTLQQLPHHMRRRAASHNPNRVPRRVREKAAREIIKAKKKKRPSRRHRRRPSNLLKEYIRRSRNNIWLETHMWFAKRFKMEKLWGYYIPVRPNEKGERSSYRAAKHFTFLQDMSYLCCIEIKGTVSLLLEKFAKITNKFAGFTFAAKSFMTGKREGSTVLYHPDSFPYSAIGPVTFIWQPSESFEESNDMSEVRKLWIWCHPLIHQELFNVLKTLFELQEIKQEDDVSTDTTEDTMSSSELLDKRLLNKFKKTKMFSGENGAQMTLLKDNLVRHRLIGPRSQAIVADVLKTADVSIAESVDRWWDKCYANKTFREAHEDQSDFWEDTKDINSPAAIPARIVLGLTVKDPRLDLPPKRTFIESSEDAAHADNLSILSDFIPDLLALSPIWDKDVREAVTATKQPESVLNKLRAEFLVPGTSLELGREESRIPIILVQQPDIDGHGSGWDLIAPLGWGMAFWIAFIYRGARAYGLQELKVLSRDCGSQLFPYNYPDTDAGQKWQEECRKSKMTKHFRYPPDKRPSFKKFGTTNPFFMPWKKLIEEVTLSSDVRYFVLRNKKQLVNLRSSCDLLTKLSRHRGSVNTRDGAMAKDMLSNMELLIKTSDVKYSIVCLKFESLSRGTLCSDSGVYVLDTRDYSTLVANMKYGGPVEPIHEGEPKVKCVKKRKRCKMASEIDPEVKLNEKLQVPVIENLMNHCSRNLIGYVETGGNSYIRGCGRGIGHCSFVKVVEVLKHCLEFRLPPVVLVRPQHVLQYRVALFDVIIL